MQLPAWFCPVVCAGLDMNELMPPRPSNNQISPATAAKKFRFAEKKPKNKNPNAVTITSFEENEAINMDRDLTVDPQDDE